MKIRSAKIKLTRIDNAGEASADVWIGVHDRSTLSELQLGPAQTGTEKLGTLARGETKWFDIPKSLHDALSSKKGFVLLNRNPAAARHSGAEYAITKGNQDDWRAGAFHVVWEEDL